MNIDFVVQSEDRMHETFAKNKKKSNAKRNL